MCDMHARARLRGVCTGCRCGASASACMNEGGCVLCYAALGHSGNPFQGFETLGDHAGYVLRACRAQHQGHRAVVATAMFVFVHSVSLLCTSPQATLLRLLMPAGAPQLNVLT
jgi:hypothetical protein